MILLLEFDGNASTLIKENFGKQFVEKLDLITWPTPPSYLNINYNNNN